MSVAENDIDGLLNRPVADRRREHRYRCAQGIVFGLPVVTLQILGPHLGGHEAIRWIALLQTLLAGWVVYIGAMGMFSEGLLRWFSRGRITPDLVVAFIVIGLYLASLLSFLHLLVTTRLWFSPLCFHWTVILLVTWTAIQWYRLRSPH